jgi:hypothetical protein
MSEPIDGKPTVEHASSTEEAPTSYNGTKLSQEAGVVPALRGMQPPAIIANLTAEQRLELETRLRKKIDLRLMPMIIIMYIMNYIDR